MRVRRMARGQSLPELLVCVAIVGFVALRTLTAYSGVVTAGDPSTRSICEQNKRRLSATLVAWRMEDPRRASASLPAAYPELRAQGWLEEIPYEPGTRSWSHTYRTTPKGNLVCLVHDLGQTRDPAQDRARRMPELEILAALLILATFLVWRWARGLPRDPLGVLSPELGSGRALGARAPSGRREGKEDREASETAREVREFLAGLLSK